MCAIFVDVCKFLWYIIDLCRALWSCVRAGSWSVCWRLARAMNGQRIPLLNRRKQTVSVRDGCLCQQSWPIKVGMWVQVCSAGFPVGTRASRSIHIESRVLIRGLRSSYTWTPGWDPPARQAELTLRLALWSG